MPQTTQIIVPLMGSTAEAMASQVDRALAAGAEAIELRMDALADPAGQACRALLSQVRAKAGPSRALVVTCRDKRQGGVIDHPLSARIEVWLSALRAGADFIDVELENLPLAEMSPVLQALACSQRTRLILSSHAWEGRFASLSGTYEKSLSAYGGAVPKLVYTARHINECFEALDLLCQGRGQKIVFCMGGAGLVTRVLAKKLGSLFTYASLDPAGATAPGQIPIDQMKGLYRSDRIDDQTEFYGVVGDPVAHSMSPAIHNACFQRLGMNRVYLPLWVEGGRDEFFAFMDSVLARPGLGLRGFSITVPHKQTALEYAKARGGSVQGLAGRIGAVNTLLLDPQGQIQAFNTDYVGAMDAIFSALGISSGRLEGWPVAVVGAGGVARAIVAGLLDAEADVTVFNRTPSKARALAQSLGCRHAALEDPGLARVRLLVNCTTVGMHPNVESSPVDPALLHPDMAVFDTVYNPARTRLLELAAQKGATCIDGVAMFVNQALAQFHLFTGQTADAALMREVVTQSLAAM